MPYVIEKCIAGCTTEVKRYYTIRTGGTSEKVQRAERQKPTSERAAKHNLREAEKHLRLMMNTNFTDDDYSLTLTYDEEHHPEDIKVVRKDVTDFVRKLRWTAKQFGIELKYVYCIGAGPHRRHIHILINRLPDMAMVAGCWTKGHVNFTKLYTKGQYRELAAYYIKNSEETRAQEREQGLKPMRRFNCSHNLQKPKITKTIVGASEWRKEPRIPKNRVLEKHTLFNGVSDITGFPFQVYTLLEDYENYINNNLNKRKLKSIRAGARGVQNGVRRQVDKRRC